MRNYYFNMYKNNYLDGYESIVLENATETVLYGPESDLKMINYR